MKLVWFSLHLASLFFAFSSAQKNSTLQEQLLRNNITALFPGDAGYAASSQAYNLRYTVEPIAITFPTNAEQISTVVKVGAGQRLSVVARSGGHSYIANGLGGKNGSLVVDLSKLKNITVDPVTKNAVIEPGNRLGDIALALNDAGRGLPHGRCAYVGIGGHSGFGGWGFASRMWGMTLDNVLSATVVLANGTIVTASEDSNSELYWGIRGSSASFGIVASINFRTFAVPPSATGFLYAWNMSISTAFDTFAAWQSFSLSDDIPVEIGGEIAFAKGVAYGQVLVFFLGAYFGPAETFNTTVAPFLSQLPPTDNVTVTQGTYIEALAAIAVGDLDTSIQPESPDTYYAKSLMAPQDVPLTNESMDALVTYMATDGFKIDGFWHVEVELYGGKNSALNAPSLNATAFAHRNSLFTFQPYASSPGFVPPYPSNYFGFVDGLVSSITLNMPRDWAWGAYPNYIEDRLPHWQQRYYGSNYDRLKALKASVDPFDVFHFPTSIQE